MCMAWRFHFPIRNYDFNQIDTSCVDIVKITRQYSCGSVLQSMDFINSVRGRIAPYLYRVINFRLDNARINIHKYFVKEVRASA